MAGEPIFPGGTSISHLRVYDWPAPDAPHGSGSPHLHTTSTEAYVVLGGQGRVETLGPEGFASHELTPGRIVWFSPGVVHRVVNDGDLEVLVLMSNAGLPEAGDAVLTFPPQVLASSSAYRDAVTLPRPTAGPGGEATGGASGTSEVAGRRSGAETGGESADGASGTGEVPAHRSGAESDTADDAAVARAARARRDLALEGYARLREAVDAHGPPALEPLYRAASRLVAGPAAHWRDLWTTTVARAAADTERVLGSLAGGSAEPMDAVGHLMLGAVATADARPGPRRYGMCGRLRTWPLR